jgi:hypothetical protein
MRWTGPKRPPFILRQSRITAKPRLGASGWPFCSPSENSRRRGALCYVRRHVRRQLDVAAQVTWKDGRGQAKSLAARVLDLSAEGARLETGLPIPARTSIVLHSARHGMLGTAVVRHCVRRQSKYSIGIEFTLAGVLADPGRERCMEEAGVPDEDAAAHP